MLPVLVLLSRFSSFADLFSHAFSTPSFSPAEILALPQKVRRGLPVSRGAPYSPAPPLRRSSAGGVEGLVWLAPALMGSRGGHLELQMLLALSVS